MTDLLSRRFLQRRSSRNQLPMYFARCQDIFIVILIQHLTYPRILHVCMFVCM